MVPSPPAGMHGVSGLRAHLNRGTSALWMNAFMAGLVTQLVRCRMRRLLGAQGAGGHRAQGQLPREVYEPPPSMTTRPAPLITTGEH